MLEITYDRDARMLYSYFADIEEGEDSTQVEVDGRYVLDAAGQIVALEFDTAGVVFPDALRYAVGQFEVDYDSASGLLRLRFTPVTAASAEPLPFPAIF